MKFTLFEVLDSYVVVDNDTGIRVSYSGDSEDDTVQVYFVSEGVEYEDTFDGNQIVKADGDIFTVTPEDSRMSPWELRALKTVRLNEVPEIR